MKIQGDKKYIKLYEWGMEGIEGGGGLSMSPIPPWQKTLYTVPTIPHAANTTNMCIPLPAQQGQVSKK